MTPETSKTLHLEIKDSPLRADVAILNELKQNYPFITRARLKRWFREGWVTLHGRAIPASEELPPGSHMVHLRNWDESFAHPMAAAPSPNGCFLPILYEDEQLLILHKRAGTPSVPQSTNETQTAVNAALAHFPDLATIGRGGLEPGILHRLDTGTSGILVFAKTQAEFDRLLALWKTPQVLKTYRAIARNPAGVTKSDPTFQIPCTIDFPLAHDIKSDKRMIALTEPFSKRIRGKPLPAITRILAYKKIAPGLLDLQIAIETGVMHQIRCHLAALGWPILGDQIYGGVPSSRLWLHAWRMQLPLSSGAQLHIEAPLPSHWPGSSD